MQPSTIPIINPLMCVHTHSKWCFIHKQKSRWFWWCLLMQYPLKSIMILTIIMLWSRNVYCDNVFLPGSAQHPTGRKFRKYDMAIGSSLLVGILDELERSDFWNDWKCMKWTNCNEWIELNELKLQTLDHSSLKGPPQKKTGSGFGPCQRNIFSTEIASVLAPFKGFRVLAFPGVNLLEMFVKFLVFELHSSSWRLWNGKFHWFQGSIHWNFRRFNGFEFMHWNL